MFDTAVDNPYHFPPRWLNEGLAVYLSEGYGARGARASERRRPRRQLIPLDGLSGQFPTTPERFFLAYAESVVAVDYLVRTHGQDALVELIGSYADGVTDDEAFKAAIGQDVAAFDAAWLADLGRRGAVAPSDRSRHPPVRCRRRLGRRQPGVPARERALRAVRRRRPRDPGRRVRLEPWVVAGLGWSGSSAASRRASLASCWSRRAARAGPRS